QDVLSSEITENIDDITFLQFMQLDESQRNRGKTIFVNSVETVLEKGVRVENIQTAREEVNATVRFSSLDEEVKKAFYKLTNFSVVENSFFDFEKTMEARKQATSTVEPVIIR